MDFNLSFATEDVVKGLTEARGEPEWLLRDRLRALEAFRALPPESNTTFIRHTDLKGVEVGNAEMLPWEPHAPSREFDGKELAAAVHLVQGRLDRVVVSKALEENGVIIDGAHGLLKNHPDLARQILAQPGSLPPDDKFGQMSRALFGNGLVIHIPPGLAIQKPIYVDWRFGGEGRALLTRTLIHVGRGSRASVIEEYSSDREGSAQGIFGNAGEFAIEDRAELRYAGIEFFADNIVSFMTRQTTTGEAARYRPSYGSFGGFYSKLRSDTHLVGRGSSIYQTEVVYGRGQERFDNTDYVKHTGADTFGESHTKAAMQEKSRSVMKGIMTIEETAINADSFLSQYAMLLSRQAKSSAIPSLEIKTNNVQRAKHSASVAQVDEEHVFYLMSRGIPRGQAQKMLVEGFLAPLVEQIEFPQARQRLWDLIGAKWAG